MEGNTVMLVNLNHTLNHTLTLTLTLLPQSVIALIVDKVYNLLLEEEEDGNHTNLTHQSLSQLLLPLRGVCWHWKRAMDDLWFKLKLLNLYDQLLVPLVHPPDDNNNNNANLPVSPWFFRFFFNGKTARNWAAGLDHFCIRTRAVVGVRDCITR